ncbi:MAG: prepilin-type N-terminal cleavage/methylation domain-containing protein, partial [Patescibacteria group bacterium]
MNVYFREKTVANQKGLTLIELMIVVTIALSISGAVLAQFKVGEQSRNVRIAADDIQSALRLMQNNALSGIPYQTGSPSTPAKDFGWRVDMLLPTRHTTFVDSPTNILRVLENLTLPPKVSIRNLIADSVAA